MTFEEQIERIKELLPNVTWAKWHETMTHVVGWHNAEFAAITGYVMPELLKRLSASEAEIARLQGRLAEEGELHRQRVKAFYAALIRIEDLEREAESKVAGITMGDVE